MRQNSVHDQIPIEIYRDSVGHQTKSSSHTDDSDVLQEHAIEELDDPQPRRVVEEAHLIIQVPPTRHFETNISKTDHLEEREFVRDPSQSRESDGEVVDEDGSDPADVKVVDGEVTAEFPQSFDVPNVDCDVTGVDGVPSSTFLDEVTFFGQGSHLTRTIVGILLMDGDGEWKRCSVLDATDGCKRDQHVLQGSTVSFQVFIIQSHTTETDEKSTKNLIKI